MMNQNLACELNTTDINKNYVVAFDDMLQSKQKEMSPFFTRVKLENIDVFCLSQRYFELRVSN